MDDWGDPMEIDDFDVMDWQFTPPAAEINAIYNPAMLERKRPRDEFEIPNMPGSWIDYYTERQFNLEDVEVFRHLAKPSVFIRARRALGQAKRRCVEVVSSAYRQGPLRVITIVRQVRQIQAERRRRPNLPRRSPRQSPRQSPHATPYHTPPQYPRGTRYHTPPQYPYELAAFNRAFEAQVSAVIPSSFAYGPRVPFCTMQTAPEESMDIDVEPTSTSMEPSLMDVDMDTKSSPPSSQTLSEIKQQQMSDAHEQEVKARIDDPAENRFLNFCSFQQYHHVVADTPPEQSVASPEKPYSSLEALKRRLAHVAQTPRVRKPRKPLARRLFEDPHPNLRPTTLDGLQDVSFDSDGMLSDSTSSRASRHAEVQAIPVTPSHQGYPSSMDNADISSNVPTFVVRGASTTPAGTPPAHIARVYGHVEPDQSRQHSESTTSRPPLASGGPAYPVTPMGKQRSLYVVGSDISSTVPLTPQDKASTTPAGSPPVDTTDISSFINFNYDAEGEIIPEGTSHQNNAESPSDIDVAASIPLPDSPPRDRTDLLSIARSVVDANEIQTPDDTSHQNNAESPFDADIAASIPLPDSPPRDRTQYSLAWSVIDTDENQIPEDTSHQNNTRSRSDSATSTTPPGSPPRGMADSSSVGRSIVDVDEIQTSEGTSYQGNTRSRSDSATSTTPPGSPPRHMTNFPSVVPFDHNAARNRISEGTHHQNSTGSSYNIPPSTTPPGSPPRHATEFWSFMSCNSTTEGNPIPEAAFQENLTTSPSDFALPHEPESSPSMITEENPAKEKPAEPKLPTRTSINSPLWYSVPGEYTYSDGSDSTYRRTTRCSARLAELDAARKKQNGKKNAQLSKITPLTEEWEGKVRKGLRSGHAPDYKASDFARVVPRTDGGLTDDWLNDETVNGYLKLATKLHNRNNPSAIPKSHAFPSFMLKQIGEKGYKGVERWAKRAKIGGSDLLQTDTIFVPVNSGAHWTLMVVHPRKRVAHHYDSLGQNRLHSGRRWFDLLKVWLRGELNARYVEGEWSFSDEPSPQQNNSSDCGVFTVTTAKMLILGADAMSYGPSDIPTQRRRIVAELINGDFL